MKDLKISEIEYSELESNGFKNYKVGLRCITTPQTYHEDFANLVIEVKKRLNEISINSKNTNENTGAKKHGNKYNPTRR